MKREPVFFSTSGSTQGPGILETIFLNRPVSAYTVFTVKPGKLFVMEYVSAVVTRGANLPYPPGNLNDYGTVGFKDANSEHSHFILFTRSEPDGMLVASQTLRLYIPANAQVIVKVPLIPGQSGGAAVNVNGYYVPA